jgi:hypothetical protein
MKTFVNLTLILFFLLIATNSSFANATLGSASPAATRVDIRVASGGWGEANVRDIQAVLISAANELLAYFPERDLNPIIVEYNEDGPITLYRPGPNGETIVHLKVAGTYWSQFAYQFSHEFTHILARYETVKVNQNPHQWFEESICVTASVFTLRQMAITWKTAPPYSNWKSYAPSLRKYADDAISKSGRQLQSDQTLAEWYKENESDLKSEDVNSPEARDKQFIVASKLLPLFERNPDLWESVGYLSVKKSDSPYLQNYLNNWYTSAPQKYRQSIRQISYLFRE